MNMSPKNSGLFCGRLVAMCDQVEPVQLIPGTAACLHDSRKPQWVAHVRTEHHAEQARLREREIDVRTPRRDHGCAHALRRNKVIGGAKAISQFLEPLHNQRCEDRFAVLKVVVRRLVRAPSKARDLAHAQRCRAALLKQQTAGR